MLLQAKWIFLRVNSRTSVAFRVEEVHRVLHKRSADYEAHLAEAKSLAAFLGVSPDEALPGVLAVLSQGDVWAAGDAHIQGSAAGTSYLSIGRNLFEGSAQWCRGALLHTSGVVYIAEPDLLRGAPSGACGEVLG